MDFIFHEKETKSVAELQTAEDIIREVQDALDIMVNAQYLGAEALIIHERHLCSEFFDLRTGIAGEILQKFSNYRMRLAIVGDFGKYTSKSLRDFIFESNKSGRIFFLPTVDQAKEALFR